MTSNPYRLILELFLFVSIPLLLKADEGRRLFVGPEIYHVDRHKEGGAKQDGTLYGVRFGYEKLKRYKFYYAVDGLYSEGTLEGKNEENHIRSKLYNSTLETRFGYTFQTKCFPYVAFTPFFGVGYSWEYNEYVHPSPIKVKFDNQFPYLPLGCLLSCHINENLKVGLNFTARFLWDGKQEIKDPEFGKLTQCYEEHIQYRIELPVDYRFCYGNQNLGIRLTPFYEDRHYGTSINYPFDFLDTKLRFYGASLELEYYF